MRLSHPVMRVPLIVRFPARSSLGEPGQRIEQIVRTADLLPTVLDVLGIEIPPGLDGVSLLPAIAEGAPLGLLAYGETGRSFKEADPEQKLPGIPGKARMLQGDRWKIVYRHDGSGPNFKLYDLDSDPEEREDVAARQPEVLAEMRAKLEGLMASDVEPATDYRDYTEDEIKVLRELGYVQ
jgi:arylsulfatase A-like enzyme